MIPNGISGLHYADFAGSWNPTCLFLFPRELDFIDSCYIL